MPIISRSTRYDPVFILGRFLLGFWAGRALLLHKPEENRPLLTRIFWVGLVLGLLGSTLAVLRDRFSLVERLPVLGEPVGKAALEILTSTGSIALASAYGTGFALLYLRPEWRQRLNVLAPVGRMALTNYLLQTMICMTLFYGIGFGIGPRFGLPGQLLTFAALFGAQIWFSHWWLARYRFGPAEWAWRSLTYGHTPPMKLASSQPRDTSR